MDSNQPVNPYIAGSPVTGTEMFFGRQDVFSFVKRNLIGQHRDTPVVLYGQRRTGKTSVLSSCSGTWTPGTGASSSTCTASTWTVPATCCWAWPARSAGGCGETTG